MEWHSAQSDWVIIFLGEVIGRKMEDDSGRLRSMGTDVPNFAAFGVVKSGTARWIDVPA
jgi:hypothetical protein